MSTPWNKIFKKTTSLFDDPILLNLLNDEEFDELLSLFLNHAKSIYFKSCKKNLLDIEEPSVLIENFTYEESNEFIISNYPSNLDENAIKLICRVNDIDITTYTFNADSLLFTITSELNENDEIQCGYRFYGQFNDDLTDEEQWIASHCINLIWLNRKIYKEENLRVKLGNKDYNSPSIGNLLDKLIDLKKITEKNLDAMINSYTFNDFSGFN